MTTTGPTELGRIRRLERLLLALLDGSERDRLCPLRVDRDRLLDRADLADLVKTYTPTAAVAEALGEQGRAMIQRHEDDRLTFEGRIHVRTEPQEGHEISLERADGTHVDLVDILRELAGVEPRDFASQDLGRFLLELVHLR